MQIFQLCCCTGAQGRTPLNAMSRIWSFFDDDKLFRSLESEHFKIHMKENFVSGPDSALAQLPFPVQFSINSGTKWSFKYFSFCDLCLTELCALCLLHLNLSG